MILHYTHEVRDGETYVNESDAAGDGEPGGTAGAEDGVRGAHG